MDMSKSVMLCCLLSVQPCYAGYVFVSPKLGVYGEALGGPDTVGKAVKQADGTKIAPKIWYYAPRTPLFGVDIGYQADNGLLFRVNLDAALTRLMFRSQCVVGYSLRFGWGGGNVSIASGIEGSATVDDAQYEPYTKNEQGTTVASNTVFPCTVLEALVRDPALTADYLLYGMQSCYAIPLHVGVSYYLAKRWGIECALTASLGISMRTDVRVPYAVRIGPVFRV